jgi:hypothetical protein
MLLIEVATLERKSGEAEGSAVRHSGAANLLFYNHFPLSSRLPRLAVGRAVEESAVSLSTQQTPKAPELTTR